MAVAENKNTRQNQVQRRDDSLRCIFKGNYGDTYICNPYRMGRSHGPLRSGMVPEWANIDNPGQEARQRAWHVLPLARGRHSRVPDQAMTAGNHISRPFRWVHRSGSDTDVAGPYRTGSKFCTVYSISGNDEICQAQLFGPSPLPSPIHPFSILHQTPDTPDWPRTRTHTHTPPPHHTEAALWQSHQASSD